MRQCFLARFIFCIFRQVPLYFPYATSQNACIVLK